MMSGVGCSIFSDDISKAFNHIPDDRFTVPGRYKDGTHLEVGPKLNDLSDVWLTVHRNSMWIRKTN